jgi:hypothetical protein
VHLVNPKVFSMNIDKSLFWSVHDINVEVKKIAILQA